MTTWLTVAEVGERLRVSKVTAYRLIRAGDIVSHKFGGQLRVSDLDLTAYIERSVKT